tara:strand:- start:13099 stop:13833 length:735 start_codon:yes stop_codon:yes gene_type:complete
MEIFNRSTLKGFFQKGKAPTEVHFTNLIDSTINKIDDGFAKTVENGLKLAPDGESSQLISFYDDIRADSPLWSVSVNPSEMSKGLSVAEGNDDARLFLQNGGNVGVGTLSPQHALDVNGAAGMRIRVGTYQTIDEVSADGEWHIVLDELSGCQAFEIVAKVEGVAKRGKYAMAHAIAVSAHDGSRNKISTTQTSYGWFWHRLRFRWKKVDGGTYRLEMKTNSHYGTNAENNVIQIQFHITSLWN